MKYVEPRYPYTYTGMDGAEWTDLARSIGALRAEWADQARGSFNWQQAYDANQLVRWAELVAFCYGHERRVALGTMEGEYHDGKLLVARSVEDDEDDAFLSLAPIAVDVPEWGESE